MYCIEYRYIGRWVFGSIVGYGQQGFRGLYALHRYTTRVKYHHLLRIMLIMFGAYCVC